MESINNMTALDFVSLAVSNLNYTIDAALYDWTTRQKGWQHAQGYWHRFINASEDGRLHADELIMRMEEHGTWPQSIPHLRRIVHRYVRQNERTATQEERSQLETEITGIIMDMYEF